MTGLGLSPLFAARPLLALVAGSVFIGGLQTLNEGRPLTPMNVALSALSVVVAAVAEGVIKALIRRLQGLIDSVQALLESVERGLATLAGVVFMGLLLGLWGRQITSTLFSSNGASGDLQLLAAGVTGELLLLGAVGSSIWTFSWMRGQLARVVALLPWAADASAKRLYGLLEGTLTVLAVSAVMVWPIVGGALFLVCAAACVAGFRAARGFDARQRTDCPACRYRVHRSASSCPRCGAGREPLKLGVLGRVRGAAVSDAAGHRLQLLGARRCSRCAEPLKPRGLNLGCAHCGEPPFQDTHGVEAFVAYADKRFVTLLPALVLLGLLPVIGAMLGLWLFRVSPAAALGAFADWQVRLRSGVLRGVGLLVLIGLQPVPIAGGLALPIFVGMLHLSNRRAARASLGRGPAGTTARLATG